MDKKPLEKELVRVVLQYLQLRNIMAWRNNSGAVFSEYKGKKRMIRYGLKGSADILAVLPPNGKMLAIECKIKPNKASKLQEEFLDEVIRNGGIGMVAYDVQDVIDVIG